MTRRLVLVALLGSLSLAAAPLAGQVRLRSNEVRLLRDAANRESRGDLDGAATILRQILDEDPGSSGALFALERVLRASGRTNELLPAVDRFLAADPSSSGVRYLKLRVLAEVDSLEEVRAESEAWIADNPRAESTYREVARVYERAFGPPEALTVLMQGRQAVGRDDALALEIGDLKASMGDRDGAIDEWAAAVGDEGAQTVTVMRRIQALGTGVTEAGRRLVGRVGASGRTARRRSAARIALDLALADEAMELSRGVAEELEGAQRETFLADVARRAREQELVEIAAWAYQELGQEAGSLADRREFDLRLVELALQAGDTVGALEAQRRVAESYGQGSVDRRRATAEVIRLEAIGSAPDELRGRLDGFRSDYPNAPELDELAATVAGALAARGDSDGARDALAGIDGPRSALESGFLLLGNGDVEGGRSALLLAVTGLPPTQATAIIQYASLFDRISVQGAELLASAGVAEHRGQVAEAVSLLSDGVPELAPADQAPLLAEAARIAARAGQPTLAAAVNETIVVEYPESPEVGEASLSLARFYARSPGGVPEAIRLLEELIIQRPNAAIVPDARAELQRLRSGIE